MAKALVLTPLESEFEPFVAALAAHGHAGRRQPVGRLEVLAIDSLGWCVAQGGHGKTQFGIQAQHLLDHLPEVQLVVCAGAAGGLAPTTGIGDVVVASETIEHDYTLRFVQRPLPRFAGSDRHLAALAAGVAATTGFPVHVGPVASGDEDVIDRGRALELYAETGALAVAWEGAGGARAARFSGLPYLEVRGLTDVADSEAPVVFRDNLQWVMPRMAALLITLLQPALSD